MSVALLPVTVRRTRPQRAWTTVLALVALALGICALVAFVLALAVGAERRGATDHSAKPILFTHGASAVVVGGPAMRKPILF